jgi:hypothetical protein
MINGFYCCCFNFYKTKKRETQLLPAIVGIWRDLSV